MPGPQNRTKWDGDDLGCSNDHTPDVCHSSGALDGAFDRVGGRNSARDRRRTMHDHGGLCTFVAPPGASSGRSEESRAECSAERSEHVARLLLVFVLIFLVLAAVVDSAVGLADLDASHSVLPGSRQLGRVQGPRRHPGVARRMPHKLLEPRADAARLRARFQHVR